ncbi:hypothetical protein [Rhodoflexus caldus]|uniref:hypothetical protein n=1 Tax=Rhodoflexus caldus TaxID=2891236 RepID=UPI00202A5570|nr:hypothetical protein [Rhodoflexus caldus]
MALYLPHGCFASLGIVAIFEKLIALTGKCENTSVKGLQALANKQQKALSETDRVFSTVNMKMKTN